MWTTRADVGDFGQRSALRKDAVDELPTHNPQLTCPRLAGGEARPAAPGGQPRRPLVVDVEHRGGVLTVHAALSRCVFCHAAMPVQVICGDVEHRSGTRVQLARPVQLE
jgi:hypothetical protein